MRKLDHEFAKETLIDEYTGAVTMKDKKENRQRKLTVKLTSDLVEQGFRLLSYEFIQEDGSGNICIKVTAEIPGKDKSTITWIYKYSNNGQPEAVIVEKEISFKTSEHWSLRTREGRAYNLIWYPKDFDRGIQLITLGGRS